MVDLLAASRDILFHHLKIAFFNSESHCNHDVLNQKPHSSVCLGREFSRTISFSTSGSLMVSTTHWGARNTPVIGFAFFVTTSC